MKTGMKTRAGCDVKVERVGGSVAVTLAPVMAPRPMVIDAAREGEIRRALAETPDRERDSAEHALAEVLTELDAVRPIAAGARTYACGADEAAEVGLLLVRAGAHRLGPTTIDPAGPGAFWVRMVAKNGVVENIGYSHGLPLTLASGLALLSHFMGEGHLEELKLMEPCEREGEAHVVIHLKRDWRQERWLWLGIKSMERVAP
jgi:hypothetical protein